MEVLTPEKLINIFKKKFKVIITAALIGFLIGILYVLIFFRPAFTASTKLLIKNNDRTFFLTEFDNSANLISLGKNTDPLQTQIQIIKSHDFAKQVWQKISQKYSLKGSDKEGAQIIENSISVKNPEKTDIIIITASWTDPEIARDISKELASLYIISNIDNIQKEMLRKKLAIDNQLTELLKNKAKQADLVNIINVLKAKQIEAQIKETEFINNISVIDPPTAAIYCIFPNRVQVITLFTLFAALFAMAGLIMETVIKNTYDDIEQMEKELCSPVLGVIPWLDQENYDEPDILFPADEFNSLYSLAYQKIVSGLRIKGYNSNINALAFTSSEFSKSRSTIIMNIAYSLNKTGQSVIVVDADFRTPSLGQEFRLKVNDKFNLGELLSEISKEAQLTGHFNWENLNYFIQELSKTNNFYIIPNVGNVPDPCEFLYSTSFKQLIQELKKRYDWVLVDVPPALAVPDALTVSSSVDGMVLITGLDANKSILRKIYKQFKNYNIPIFGIVAREIETQETSFSNEYIKQMINKMMPQNEGLLTEE